MAELGARHADLEGRGELDALLETLAPDPVYEFHPARLCMRGDAMVRRFYTQFCERFLPMQEGYTLVASWASETSVAQEYDVSVRVDGIVEQFRVLGILYARGDRLGGERVYAPERFIRLMTGDLFDELTSLD